ncbi:peptidoglycan DD-metalloendopeptidase family protein [Nocardia arizonensis]|uniref:peptidoglycan DD-metalloendopeptidase family protein n=1 Tax=Nocardia arizonensis TaxID=1141647 RepID=UPI000ACE8FC9|nr:peptidoglycan DD-metalloendopeptidase family protein [Nocardia arizonensis]
MSARFWPVAAGFWITSSFGPREGGWHFGVDFGFPGGAGDRPVFACQGGTVTRAGPAHGFGSWIVIDHPDAEGGGTTVYGHIRPEVGEGQWVAAGQRIAVIEPDRSRNAGVAPHLHLEWHRGVYSPPGPDRLDPLPLLDGAAFPEGGLAMPEYGIDVSNHQGKFDFARAAAEGMSFVTHKVSQGTWQDPQWPRAREQMGEFFEFWGGYLYCDLHTHPDIEADALARFADTSIPIQIDYEDLRGFPSIGDLWARVNAITARGFSLLPIYLPRWYWRDLMGSPDLSGFPVPLWNSSYVPGLGTPDRLYPGDGHRGWEPFGGKEVAILQFSDRAAIGGQLIDVNAIRGGRDTVAALFGRNDMQLTDIVINKDGNPVTLADLLASIDMHASWVVDQLAGPDSRHQPGPALDPTGWPQLDDKSVVDSVASAHTKIDAVTATLAEVQDKIQVILEHLVKDASVGRHRAPEVGQ